jgi:hypothetical protein
MITQIFQGIWTISDVQNNPNLLFIYGDNDKKFGKKGQAVIRDEVNTIGIPTKKYPSNYSSSFYTDDEYNLNVSKINGQIQKVITILQTGIYDGIVLPECGLGTGLSQLPTKAPRTFEYLCGSIDNLQNTVESM